MEFNKKTYRGWPALNASYLKQVLLYSKWRADIPLTPTAAMNFGTAAHTKILEPELFDTEYSLFDFDLRTKQGKMQKELFDEMGLKPLKPAELAALEAMNESVRRTPDVAKMLDEGEVEQCYLFTFENEHESKAQIDLYHPDSFTLVDLKTIADISKAERQFWSMRYDLQMAWYREALIANGKPVDSVKILFVETQAPYQAALFDVSEESMDVGYQAALDAVLKWQRQSESDSPELITGTLTPPPWMVQDNTQEVNPFG